MVTDTAKADRLEPARDRGLDKNAADPVHTPLFGYSEPLRPDELVVTSFGWKGRGIRRVTCPHCWQRFHLGDILWVATHPSLRGDPIAGEDAMRRFLPSRYNAQGNAIDAGGSVCHDLACPVCRLPVARSLLEARQLYFSLVGVPSSGKTYLTAAMSWRLRELLPRRFGWGFQDVDPAGNAALIEHEQTLFLHDKTDEPVCLEKTQMHGAHYDYVRFGSHQASLARPFQFLLSPPRVRTPSDCNPEISETELPARIINLYDNAGEHFLPGNDDTLTPGTRHVAHANVLMFLFDPMQDPRCRAAMQALSRDPQLDGAYAHGTRQDTILNEMGRRIRRYSQLSETARLEQPLIVLVSKADAWLELAGVAWGEGSEPLAKSGDGSWGVDTVEIERVSRGVRGWLEAVTPEFVSLAESMHRKVRYLPVSALGGPPEPVGEDARLMVRPSHLAPRWVAAPILYALSKWSRQGLPEAVDREIAGQNVSETEAAG